MSAQPDEPHEARNSQKSFDPAAIEARGLGPIWESRGYFTARTDRDKPSFSIQLPPPNRTGVLHMVSVFNHTIMDALTRYHCTRGFNTLWLLGTDHAGIATQIVAERQLETKGIDRRALGRQVRRGSVEVAACPPATQYCSRCDASAIPSIGAALLHDGREPVPGRRRNLRGYTNKS